MRAYLSTLLLAVLAVLLLAAFPVLASGAGPEAIGAEGARHLLSRTGFGVTAAEVRDFAALTREQAVDRLLAGARREATTPPPAFLDGPVVSYRDRARMSVEERMADNRRNREQGLALREWWLREMLATPSPLTERMTLFWHNHFATSQQKVRLAPLMYRQNVLLRREALGNFGTLLHGMVRDPAMLVWLDNAQSRRGAPNENFARELMELFTLGEGHYTEADIKEAARAFTGHSIDRATLEYRWRPMAHDRGGKTLFGRTGNFDGDAVLDLLLARPETASFVASKLWRELVSPTPDAAELARAASAFRDSGYEVKPMLRALLLTEAFWAPASRGTLVKSPVELVVGTLRSLHMRPASLRPAVFACAMLGQNPFSPPNVKGWPGGEAWIDSATLLGRKQFVDRVSRGVEGSEADPTFLLAVAPVNPPPEGMAGADLVRHLMADPAYQLK